MIAISSFAGQTIAVFGLGRSGLATCAALQAGGAVVAAWDDNPAARAEAERAGWALVDLAAADWSAFASLVLAPGVPLTHPTPHWTVVRAQAANVPIIGDVELFERERAARGAGCPLIAITGTNGKSTTTALTAHILAEAGFDVAMGGNIGTAVLSLPDFAAHRVYVLELSSYQLDLAPSLHPNAAVLLNITPDHLDRHGTMANYAAVKAKIFSRQIAGDTAVIGLDDPYCREIYQALAMPSGPKRVALLPDGADLRDVTGDAIRYSDLRLTTTGADAATIAFQRSTPIQSLKGAHNAQNAAAAFALARAVGAPIAAIAAALDTFPGLAHRLQPIGQRGRVVFVNDSKATNAESTDKALTAYPGDIYWIAGGKPKAGGIESLRPHFGKIARAFLIGEAAPQFAETLADACPVTHAETLVNAVSLAAEAADASPGSAPVVLLSPACASFDQFPNFEVRGQAFVAAVAALPGVVMLGGSRS